MVGILREFHPCLSFKNWERTNPIVTVSVDIGGTKTQFGLIKPVQDDLIVLDQMKVETVRGKKGLMDTMLAGYQWASDACLRLKEELDTHIVVGCPGFFENGMVQTASALNLESYPGELNCVDMEGLFVELLPNTCHVRVVNDAVAQLRGGIDFLLQTSHRQSMLGERVMYIGPGTGLGGALAFVSSEGKVSWIENRSLAKMKIPVDGDGSVEAEQVFSGKAVLKLMGKSAHQINQLGSDDPQYLSCIEHLAGALCVVIRGVQAVQHSRGDLPVNCFVLGGSLGVSPPMNRDMISKVFLIEPELKNQIRLISLEGGQSIALKGAFLLCRAD